MAQFCFHVRIYQGPFKDPQKKMTAMTALNCSCGTFFSETSELQKNKKHFPLKEAALPKQFQHGCSSLSSPFAPPNRHDTTKFREGKVPIIWIYTLPRMTVAKWGFLEMTRSYDPILKMSFVIVVVTIGNWHPGVQGVGFSSNPSPNNPCMVYLPAFTLKISQMWFKCG